MKILRKLLALFVCAPSNTAPTTPKVSGQFF